MGLIDLSPRHLWSLLGVINPNESVFKMGWEIYIDRSNNTAMKKKHKMMKRKKCLRDHLRPTRMTPGECSQATLGTNKMPWFRRLRVLNIEISC